MSLAIAAVILIGTWDLLRDSVNLALDAVPEGIAIPDVQTYLASLPAVVGIHDLHIWGMSTTEPALTAHLVMQSTKETGSLLNLAAEELHERFGIERSPLTEPGYPVWAVDIGP